MRQLAAETAVGATLAVLLFAGLIGLYLLSYGAARGTFRGALGADRYGCSGKAPARGQ